MNERLTLLQREVLRQIRAATYEDVADEIQHAWANGRSVESLTLQGANGDESAHILFDIAMQVHDFARANAQAIAER